MGDKKKGISNKAMDALLDKEVNEPTLADIAQADVNLYGTLTIGQYSELQSRGTFSLPVEDQQYIGALMKATHGANLKMQIIPLKRLSAVNVKESKLKGAIIRELERHCILRTDKTRAGNTVKLVRKIQPKIRQIPNKAGGGYTEDRGLSKGGFSIEIDLWKTGEVDSSAVELVKF